MEHDPDLIRRSDSSLAALTRVSPVGIFRTDAAGRLEYANTRGLAIFGMRLADARGAGWADAVHPEDRERVLAEWARAVTAPREFVERYRIIRPDGDVRTVQARAAPIQDDGAAPGFVGTVEDVTDALHAARQVRDLVVAHDITQQRVQALFEYALDAIVFVDDQGRYLDANPAATTLLGWTRDELLDKTVEEVASASAATFADLWRQLREAGELNGEMLMRRRDGMTRFVEFRAIADVLPGTHLAILRDMTERQAVREARRQHVRRLEMLTAIHRAILDLRNVRGIADAAAEQVAQLVPAVCRVSVSVFDPACGTGELIAIWSRLPTRFAVGHTFALDEPQARLIREGQPVLVGDIDALVSPSPTDRVLRSEGVRTYLRMPLRVGGRVVGALNVSSEEPQALTPEIASIAEAIAAALAVAISNAQLLEALRQRTSELSAMSRRLVEVQERERRVFARELHDEVGQVLTALTLRLDLLRSTAPERLHEGVAQAEALAGDLMATVRRLVIDLRPPLLDEFGLSNAVRAHCERFSAQTGIAIDLEAAALAAGALPPEVEIAAFRIVQESLTNVARHARVRHARVRLERSGDTLEVQIADDGTGFHAARAAGRGNGLKGMRERMELLGGELEIHSAPGRGTTIAARIVVPEETVK